jgi:6-phosphogluconolactonase
MISRWAPEEMSVSRPALVYVGSYTPEMNGGRGRGLTAFRRDPESGALSQVGELPLAAPSYLAWHPELPILYTANESGEGSVTAVACAPDGGMRVIGEPLPTGGEEPCHLAVSADGRHLLVANYGGGSVAVFALGAEGELLRRTDLRKHAGSGPNAERQESAHVHMIVPGPAADPAGGSEQDLWSAVDLGADEVRTYRLGAEGTLEEVAVTALPPGFGPRQLVREPGSRRTYLVAELASEVAVAEERAPGEFALLSTTSASARPGVQENMPAHLTLDARAQSLYVSNRGANTIALFRIEGDSLRLVTEESSGGTWPRHMTLIDRHLYIANQQSDTIAVLTADPTHGSLSLTHSYTSGSPVCIVSDQD